MVPAERTENKRLFSHRFANINDQLLEQKSLFSSINLRINSYTRDRLKQTIKEGKILKSLYSKEHPELHHYPRKQIQDTPFIISI